MNDLLLSAITTLMDKAAAGTRAVSLGQPIPVNIVTSTRSRVLNPHELAIEAAIVRAMNMDALHTYGDSPAARYWTKLVKGAVSLGAVGAIKTPGGYAVVWELFPDDIDFLGLCGDGVGDLFAVARDNVSEQITFPTLPPLT